MPIDDTPAIVQIQSVARVFPGAAAHQLNADPAGPRVTLLSVRSLRAGSIDSSEVEDASVHDTVRLLPYATQEGDVVVAARGTQLKAAIVSESVAGAILGATLIGVRPGNDIRAEVILAYLRSTAGQAALAARLRSATGQVALTARDIGEIEMPLPSANVQRIIVSVVRTTSEYAEACRNALALRERAADGVVQRLFSEGDLAHG